MFPGTYLRRRADRATRATYADAVSSPHPHDHIPAPGEPTVPELEDDENVAPRPEEEVADVLRAEPDVTDHSRHPD